MKYAVCTRLQARRQDLANILRDTSDALKHTSCSFQLPFFMGARRNLGTRGGNP